MRRLSFALGACLLAGALAAEPGPDSTSVYAPHHDADGFFNPWERFDWSLSRFLRWQLSRNPFDKSGEPSIPRVANDGSGLAGTEHSATVTWVGHATVAVHDDADVFITDPHWSERALVPRRVVPPGVPIESIPPDAFALISHNHYDHLDAGTVERLPETLAWFVPLGLADWFRARGRERVIELDWWQSTQHGRWTITCLPSQHWSRRIEQGVNESLWCAWLVDSGERRYFFAGDTGYFAGFAEYGRRFDPIDVALLPIGAYEPRWFMRYQHMNPADAVQAARDLGARHMVGIHWGTFDLTDEPLDLPPRALAEAVAAAGADPERFRTLAIGETWPTPSYARSARCAPTDVGLRCGREQVRRSARCAPADAGLRCGWEEVRRSARCAPTDVGLRCGREQVRRADAPVADWLTAGAGSCAAKDKAPRQAARPRCAQRAERAKEEVRGLGERRGRQREGREAEAERAPGRRHPADHGTCAQGRQAPAASGR